jgi:hypothetical protein
MNKHLNNAIKTLNVPWALSGSMALKLYGNKYGVSTRQPANVDIVVNANRMANAYAALAIFGRKNISRNTSIVKNKNHYNLHPYDLLRSNSSLAPSIKKYVNLNGIPVVRLENLLKYKERARNNYPKSNRKKQINANIQKIRNIMAKRSVPNKIKHRNNSNFKTPKTVKKHSNNFSTPPSSPPTIRKKLSFN